MLKRQTDLALSLGLVFDAALASAAWVLCYYVRFYAGLFPYPDAAPPPLRHFAALLPVVVLFEVVALASVGLYRPARTHSLLADWMRVARAALLAWLALLAGLYYYSRIPYSRVLLFLFLFASPVALMISRALLRKALYALRRRGLGVKRAVIVGTGRLGQEALHKLRENPWLGIDVAYFVHHEDQRRGGRVHGVPVLGSLPDLLECLREHPVDTAFVALPSQRADATDDVLDALARLPLSVAVIPDFRRAFALHASAGDLEGLPIIQLRDTPIQGWHAVAKRAIDILGSLLLLLVLGLPMLILAVLIKVTSRGPVLFRQQRMSIGGRRFTMLKFRSMRADAEEDTGPVMAEKDDPRCTRVGTFMRHLSLDELPQLLNVLRGDMSLVGPRPERPHFVEQFAGDIPAYMLRHNVKAGITGWAQVNGFRGRSSLRKRLQYDFYYINNWSLGFDLFILVVTPFRGLVNRHA